MFHKRRNDRFSEGVPSCGIRTYSESEPSDKLYEQPIIPSLSHNSELEPQPWEFQYKKTEKSSMINIYYSWFSIDQNLSYKFQICRMLYSFCLSIWHHWLSWTICLTKYSAQQAPKIVSSLGFRNHFKVGGSLKSNISLPSNPKYLPLYHPKNHNRHQTNKDYTICKGNMEVGVYHHGFKIMANQIKTILIIHSHKLKEGGAHHTANSLKFKEDGCKINGHKFKGGGEDKI